MRSLRAGAACALLSLGLASCSMESGTGYIEIKSIPPSPLVPLYLDAVKLDPFRNGNALLRHRVGLSKLQNRRRGRLPCCALQHRREEESHNQRHHIGHEPSAALPMRAHQRHRCKRDPHLHRVAHFMVGMTNSAPSLVPEGQRAVTVFVLV